MALEKEEAESRNTQNATFCSLDSSLYCEEETEFIDEEDDNIVGINEDSDEYIVKFQSLCDEEEDDDELQSLISKENETSSPCCCLCDNGFLVSCREEALDWIFRVKSRYGFTSLTMVLAVNYFDRFITSVKFETEKKKKKPWMSQLLAVACLSLAAKVDEVHVPLLLHLQVEEARFVFEAKTIQRMELLVLSTLQWRMHPVTPISFFDHIIRRFGSKFHRKSEFFKECERLLISVVADVRFVCYIPSVLATAIMVYVVKGMKLCDEVQYVSRLMTLLEVNQEKVSECYELLLLEHNPSMKRTMNWDDQDIPRGVFEYEDDSIGSSTSSAASVSLSSSSTLEPLYKRRRVQEQQLIFPSTNRMFLDVLSSPR